MPVLPALRRRVAFVGLVGLSALATEPARAQPSSLRGLVVDSVGKPIEGADVGIVSLRRLTRTDKDGRFGLPKLPAGQVELSVRRLGFEPKTVRIRITPGVDDSVHITMRSNIAQLASVNVSASEYRQREQIEDYYRRLTRGVGQYVTREEIEKRWGGTPSDLLRNTPGIRFVRVATGKGVRFPTTSIVRRDCAPMIWVDGQKAPGLEIDDLTLGDIEGIELYNGPSTTPMQFSQLQGSNNCGTIVVWSRPSQYQRNQRKP